MTELQAALQVTHANTFVLYFKAHAFHWNVEGVHFPVYHEFFADFYEELFGAVDPLAENLRKLGVYAPTSLIQLYNSATIEESTVVGTDLKEMLNSLSNDNNALIESLNKTFTLANIANEQGLADFIAGRIDTHKKHAWMLTSSLKGL